MPSYSCRLEFIIGCNTLEMPQSSTADKYKLCLTPWNLKMKSLCIWYKVTNGFWNILSAFLILADRYNLPTCYADLEVHLLVMNIYGCQYLCSHKRLISILKLRFLPNFNKMTTWCHNQRWTMKLPYFIYSPLMLEI